MLTAQARRLTGRRLEGALADPPRRPTALEAAPGVTYRERGVTANLARQVREAIEDTKLDGYGVADACAVMPWATAHLIADLTREVERRRLGRELTPQEADLKRLRASGRYSKVAYAARYLSEAAVGAYAYRPGIADRPAHLAYAAPVLEEVGSSSRGGCHPPQGDTGVTPRRVTRSRSLTGETSPRTRSSSTAPRKAQGERRGSATPTGTPTGTVPSAVLDAWADALRAHLKGTKAGRLLDADGVLDRPAVRAALTRLAAKANGHRPDRVLTRLDLRHEHNLDRADDLAAMLATILDRHGPAALEAVAADARRREEDDRRAAEAAAEAARADAAALDGPPAEVRAQLERLGIARPAPSPDHAQATPPAAPPTLEHAQAPTGDRRADLEHAARTRELTVTELTELEAVTLAAIAARTVAAERTPAYRLDPPHRDRVLEHAVAPSPVLERAQALAAFARLLDARRDGAPPLGDATLAELEHRLGRTLTLTELDLLDALPVTVRVADLDAWASGELEAVGASTGRP